MNSVPTGAVSNTNTSIHPDTPPVRPDGQGWKTNRGYMGMRVEAMYGCWEPHRQSAMIKRVPFLFLLSDPACRPTSPLSPTALYCNAQPAD